MTTLFFTGCASIPVPPGIDSNIFKNTKKVTTTTEIGRGKTKRISFVQGPDQKIDGEPYGGWALMKFTDGSGNIRFRVLYRCHGISVGEATEMHTSTPLATDLLLQEDAGGALLETGAADIERELLDKSLLSGLSIALMSRGEGTVFTPTLRMKRADARGDWKAVEKMIDKGEGYQSKYTDKVVLIQVPPSYLAAFLKKADLIDIK